MNCIVVDTSVIIDMFLKTRPRHPEALKLKTYLDENQIIMRVPMHSLFEFHSAMKDEKRKANLISPTGRLPFSGEINETNPLDLKLIPIDEDFTKKYLFQDLPHMPAGDLIFVAMAKTDQCILITEDKEQYKKAKSIGIRSYKIKEFLEEFTNH